MSAVSTTEAWPARGQPFMVSDLDRLPDDGRRHDVVVVRWEDVGGAKLTAHPLSAVEIRSPSTALIDLNRKKAAYQRFGVPSYWIADPAPQEPSITAFELRQGQYTTLSTAVGREALEVERPFRVEVIPAALLAGPPSRHL